MVPKLFSSGKSFAKLGAYLLHDAEKAKSSERVKWTHTLNLANDHPSGAIDEMLWTYRAADDLKRQAGGRTGGRPLKNPVRHFSLNWHPSEQPTPEHMVETVEHFLGYMDWKEHQALIVCHDDKHPHVHVMVNAIHPETGRALDAGFERRRAQKWADRYEREHGVYCEQRLKPVAERAASPTRESWQRMKLDPEKFEDIQRSLDYFKRNDAQGKRDDEWLALKAEQRQQREHFWNERKAAFEEARNAAFREIKAEFSHEWKTYFAARKAGARRDTLTEMKADILARQNKALDDRRTEAHDLVLGHRKEFYVGLLGDQQRERDQLRSEQSAGRRSFHILDQAHPRPAVERAVEPAAPERQALVDARKAAFRDAATEVTAKTSANGKSRTPRKDTRDSDAPLEPTNQSKRGTRVADGATGIGLGVIGGLAILTERLFDGFLGGGETVEPGPQREKKPDTTREDDALDAAMAKRAREVAEEEAALLASWTDRRQRRRERD